MKSIDQPRTRTGYSQPTGYRRTSSPVPLLLILAAFVFVGWYALQVEKTPEQHAFVGGIPATVQPLPLPKLMPAKESALTYSINRGDNQRALLNKFGLSKSFAGEIENASLNLATDLKKELADVRYGNSLELRFTPEGEVSQLSITNPSGRGVQYSRVLNGYEASMFDNPFARPDQLILGTVNSSFGGDAAKLGVPYDTIDDLADLLAGKVEFRKDFRRGDRFSIILGGAVPYGDGTTNLVAAAIDVAGSRYVVTRYIGSDGKARFFDDQGNLYGNTWLRYPLKFTRISSLFSDSRMHPVLRRRKPHQGVDFAAPIGTPVRSVGSGRVVFAGYRSGSGYMVQIRHNERYSTTYLHLSRINAGVSSGRPVGKGQVIGAVGCTGLCTGPHLHFGLFDRGVYTDPLRAKLPVDEKLSPGLMIDPGYLKRVLFTVRHYQSIDPAKLTGAVAASVGSKSTSAKS
jgi:murein DD-endopeptidase MepM/ murein hydrolase activator NlpD